MSHIAGLIGLIDSPDRYNLPYNDIRGAQIAAANERFRKRVTQISLLQHQSESAGVGEICDFADLVPLLFAHTTYKSYPESWLAQGKWDRLGKWLETVSTYPINGADTNHVRDIDDWLRRLEAVGTYVSCSSGTTGKCSMIAAANPDREICKRNPASAFAWATGIEPRQQYRVIRTAPIPVSPRNVDTRMAISDEFGDGNDLDFPGQEFTIGQVSAMVALRRKLVDGTATPNEIADYEAISRERQASLEAGMERAIDGLINNRDRKLIVFGTLAVLMRVTDVLRAKGYRKKDFNPDNAMFLGGGPKGAVLPSDWREILMDTFNVSFKHLYQYYGMQELNTTMPRCAAGRYHIPPWVIPLVLDQNGERLIAPADGEVEGRGGFFDLSLDGQWGGVISGDKINVRYDRCDCGQKGASVGPDIARYADLGDGDKITCAGTIDAYVRGVS